MRSKILQRIVLVGPGQTGQVVSVSWSRYGVNSMKRLVVAAGCSWRSRCSRPGARVLDHQLLYRMGLLEFLDVFSTTPNRNRPGRGVALAESGDFHTHAGRREEWCASI